MADQAALRGDEKVPVRVERVGDEELALGRPVRVRRIEKLDAEIGGSPQQPHGLAAVARRSPDPGAGQLHRAEAEPADRRFFEVDRPGGSGGCLHPSRAQRNPPLP